MVIYIITIATAFIGYVLPWGQISFWAATVITGLFSVLPYGDDIVLFILRGFYVNNITLTTFYALHFFLPFIIAGAMGLHLQLLHEGGSSSKLSLLSSFNKTYFDSLFRIKDGVNILVLLLLLGVVFFSPYIRTDVENFIEANQIISPLEIKPEWYFLWLYAILRSVPNKIGGVFIMTAALFITGVFCLKKKATAPFRPLLRG